MSQNAADWKYWRAELAAPGSLSRDTTDKVAGYWRVSAAKTKPDTCAAIWYSPEGNVVWAVGRQRPQAGDGKEWDDFMSWTFPKCSAITKEAYHAALETGFWPDGKPVWQMTDEQKLGIEIPSGDNAAPVDESLADQITSLAATIDKTPEPSTQDQANALSGLLDKMRVLLRLAEAERVKLKEPHLQAGREVDATWTAIKAPGERSGIAGEARRKAFLKKEQARLDAEAAEERRKQQAIIDAENQRIREENAKRAAEAAEADVPEPAAVVPEIAAPAVEAQRATAGSAFGRASGLKKVTVLDTLDAEALAFHFLETKDVDFINYLTDRAKKAIRAKVTLPGVKTKDELQ